MSSSEGSGPAFQTMRGRDYPTLKQFTVFLENRVGQLLDIVRRLEISGNRILSLSINDSSDCALVRFLLRNPDTGRETFERAGLSVFESDCIGVELPESSQPFQEVCMALLRAEINIVRSYQLLGRSSGGPAIAISVDNLEAALETLAQRGFRLLHEGDLLDPGED